MGGSSWAVPYQGNAAEASTPLSCSQHVSLSGETTCLLAVRLASKKPCDALTVPPLAVIILMCLAIIPCSTCITSCTGLCCPDMQDQLLTDNSSHPVVCCTAWLCRLLLYACEDMRGNWPRPPAVMQHACTESCRLPPPCPSSISSFDKQRFL